MVKVVVPFGDALVSTGADENGRRVLAGVCDRHKQRHTRSTDETQYAAAA